MDDVSVYLHSFKAVHCFEYTGLTAVSAASILFIDCKLIFSLFNPLSFALYRNTAVKGSEATKTLLMQLSDCVKVPGIKRPEIIVI